MNFLFAFIIYLHIIVPFISTMLEIDLRNQTNECVEWMETHAFKNTQFHMDENDEDTNIIYFKFVNFTQLSNIKCTNLSIETKNLLLYAERRVLIEGYLNLNEILNVLTFTEKSYFTTIEIRNALGFSQTYNQQKFLHADMRNYMIYFTFLNFNFYLNRTLITKEMCKYENFYEKQIDFFWPLNKIYFYEVFYAKPICPYVFLNSNLKYLGLFQITNSLIFKNRFEFFEIDDYPSTINQRRNERILKLEVQIVFDELTSKILCPYVFKYLKTLEIRGAPSTIQTTLFESFTNVEYIIFNIDNLRHFFHRGIEFMSPLNRDLIVSVDRIIIIQFNERINTHLTRKYIYPDEDLCLFKEFPHEKLVLPSINIYDEVECSCTLIWLVKKYKFYESLKSASLKTNTVRPLYNVLVGSIKFQYVIFFTLFRYKVNLCKISKIYENTL